MGWFGPDEQVLPTVQFHDETKWMIVYPGGAGWRNSPDFEDREGGEGPACGEELVEAPAGEQATCKSRSQWNKASPRFALPNSCMGLRTRGRE